MDRATSRLFVISGPSGAGKGTLIANLRKRYPGLALTVSATTRAPREGEVDGIHYYFMSEDEFSKRVSCGDFLEWAKVHAHCYGTLTTEVERHLKEGRSVVLEIDVQGALQVKEKLAEAVLIFIAPPSLEVLEERLRGRATESESDIELRLQNAQGELALANRYDAIIVNDDLERAESELYDTILHFEREES